MIVIKRGKKVLHNAFVHHTLTDVRIPFPNTDWPHSLLIPPSLYTGHDVLRC